MSGLSGAGYQPGATPDETCCWCSTVILLRLTGKVVSQILSAGTDKSLLQRSTTRKSPLKCCVNNTVGDGGLRMDKLVTALVPSLSRSLAQQFNLFNVLRHGTHEKQISNIFAWLLDPDETHELGTVFQE